MWIFRSAHKHIGQDTLSEYLDGRLQGRPLERVEQQLTDCDACRQELDGLRTTVAMLQALPMEEPRRSFVMSAPPPEPARARPNAALRAPNWVYAGAASIAALAFAVTVSIDATGGLDPGLNSPDTAVTASAPIAETTVQSASRSGDTSGPSEDAAAPKQLAAAALVAPAAEQPEQGETAAGGTAAFGAEAGATGSGDATAPVAAAAGVPPPPDEGFTLTQAAAPPVVAPQPETAGSDGGESTEAPQTAKAEAIEVPLPEKGLIEEPLIDETPRDLTPTGNFLDDVVISPESAWWRVAEVATGALVVISLAGLFFRWRAGRRESA